MTGSIRSCFLSYKLNHAKSIELNVDRDSKVSGNDRSENLSSYVLPCFTDPFDRNDPWHGLCIVWKRQDDGKQDETMAMSRTTALEIARGLHEQGKCEFGPNVEIILMTGVELITCTIPREVRKQLNAAVKAGKLGHLKKDGHKPEAYFHPNSEQEAIHQRNKKHDETIRISRSVLGINHGDGSYTNPGDGR